MNVEIITIGTEILMGYVVDTHTSFIGQKLTSIGITPTRQGSVNDTPQDILTLIQEAIARADLVITTGGLGPTSDDITRNMVIQQLGIGSHLDDKALKMIEARLSKRSIPMLDSMKSQAIVPDGATVFYNDNGTAPGLAIPISKTHPKYPCKWLIMLPGPPRELRPMFEKQAMPFIQEEYRSQIPILDTRVFRIVGMGESNVEAVVEPALKDIWKDIEVGYCARMGEVDVRLVVRGKDSKAVKKLADEGEKRIRKVLGDSIFGSDHNTIEQVLVETLKKKGQWLTTAESCTGGYLANRITMVPGSSEVFRGGWVSYANEFKIEELNVPRDLINQHGAVSDPVAKAMAAGALKNSKADYALSLTGIAGPGGGTPEKPVGTVFIGLATQKETKVEQFKFPMDRETFKFISSQTALNMLRKELIK